MDGGKPAWIRAKSPSDAAVGRMESLLQSHGLSSVCTEACCPNRGECWGAGTATFMLMGDLCTRSCRFCAVSTAKEGRFLDPREGRELACAIADLGLRYAVLTSVDRDDLADRGAAHFASCIASIREQNPLCQIEALTPDFNGGELDLLLASPPDVLAHNVETVSRLQGIRDARASLAQSLLTLREAGKRGLRTKSSLLLGLGETREEVLETLDSLREVGVDILVLGQYLRPGPSQLPVAEYLTPETFDVLRSEALSRGFSSVVAAPLARTSYHAREAAASLRSGEADGGKEDV